MKARVRISARKREALFDCERGLCHLCGLLVQPGQAWDVSHEIPLACGGADDETNWKVAHRRCHRAHTAKVDAPIIAKVRRQRQAHNGSDQPASTLRSPGFAPAPARVRTPSAKVMKRKPIYEDTAK